MGQTIHGCPKKDGALWIHVLDDAGDPVKGIPVSKFSTWENTNAKGLVVIDPLAPKTYRAEIGYPIPDQYERPGQMSRPADVSSGQIAYVLFTLKRKAKLNVKIVADSDSPCSASANDQKKPFKDAAVKVSWKDLSTGKTEDRVTHDGIANWETIPAGTYKVKVEFTVKEEKFEFLTSEAEVSLEPGEPQEVVFEVASIYTQVRFIGHCLLTIPKQIYSAGKWSAKYNGKLKDSEDIQARVEFVKKTIAIAFDKVQAEDNRSTLKIFVVPECFFQGKYGAYEHDAIGVLVEKLQNVVAERKWRDWLFVFGTVNSLIPGSAGEMFNIAPVIRGGHCYAETSPRSDQDRLAAPHTRLIQKAKFSAELISKSEWEEEEGLERKPTLDEDFMFQGTENDEKLGKYFQEFLEDATIGALIAGQGLDGGVWTQLKEAVVKDRAQIGPLGVIRNIRKCKLPPGALNQYLFCGGDCLEIENPKKYEAAAVLADWQQHAGKFIREQKDFSKEAWETEENRAKIKETIQNNLASLCSQMFEYQKSTFAESLAKSGDAEWKAIVDRFPLGAAFKLSWVPIVKKIFELYLERKYGAKPEFKEVLTQAPENFDYREYRFVCERKAGPLLGEAPADALGRDKKIVFGLEICADHASGRLKNSLRPEAAKEKTVDIQLIPSCGMQPSENSITARAGGYVFNCDGWNCSYESRVTNKEGTFIKKELGGADAPTVAGKNPVYPHSILAKGGTDGQLGAKDFTPRIEPLEPHLGTGAPIFGEGPGELHIYAAQDLPKEPKFIVRIQNVEGQVIPDSAFYLEPKADGKKRITDLAGEIPFLEGDIKNVQFWAKAGNRFIKLAEKGVAGSVVVLQAPEPKFRVRFVEIVQSAGVDKEELQIDKEVFEGQIRLVTDKQGEIPIYEESAAEKLYRGGGTRPKLEKLRWEDANTVCVMYVPPAYKVRLVDEKKKPRPGQDLYLEQVEQRTTNKDGEIWFAKGQFGEQAIYIKNGDDWVKLRKVGEEGNVVLVNETAPPPEIVPTVGSATPSPGAAPPPPPPSATRKPPLRGGGVTPPQKTTPTPGSDSKTDKKDHQ